MLISSSIRRVKKAKARKEKMVKTGRARMEKKAKMGRERMGKMTLSAQNTVKVLLLICLPRLPNLTIKMPISLRHLQNSLMQVYKRRIYLDQIHLSLRLRLFYRRNQWQIHFFPRRA